MRLAVAFPLFSVDNPQAAGETQFGKPMGPYETPTVTGVYVPPLHGSRLAASEISCNLKNIKSGYNYMSRTSLLRLPATAFVEF